MLKHLSLASVCHIQYYNNPSSQKSQNIYLCFLMCYMRSHMIQKRKKSCYKERNYACCCIFKKEKRHIHHFPLLYVSKSNILILKLNQHIYMLHQHNTFSSLKTTYQNCKVNSTIDDTLGITEKIKVNNEIVLRKRFAKLKTYLNNFLQRCSL